ncbi:MAG: hypothetical protein COB71_03710 [Thiotrichales bacterium]|nr:MAG: hypothetical protein COB71_03710 [Thiotrichales bacterium]
MRGMMGDIDEVGVGGMVSIVVPWSESLEETNAGCAADSAVVGAILACAVVNHYFIHHLCQQ